MLDPTPFIAFGAGASFLTFAVIGIWLAIRRDGTEREGTAQLWFMVFIGLVLGLTLTPIGIFGISKLLEVSCG